MDKYKLIVPNGFKHLMSGFNYIDALKLPKEIVTKAIQEEISRERIRRKDGPKIPHVTIEISLDLTGVEKLTEEESRIEAK